MSIAQLSREARVNWQVIRNLEGGKGATRDTVPGNATISTALKLVQALWPDLQLCDFEPITMLDAVPKDEQCRDILTRLSAN
jgi:hypothetical protein